MPFDELNRLEAALSDRFPDGTVKKEDLDEILDMMEDLFLLAYANGVESVNVSLGADVSADVSDVQDTIDREIAGETWRDRVEDYFSNGGSVADIVRIMETEMHRDYNEAALTTARKAGAKSKTWMTMLDDRVRETHDYLQSMTVGIDEEFYTYDGDHAYVPGGFELAENNVNCRCILTFS